MYHGLPLSSPLRLISVPSEQYLRNPRAQHTLQYFDCCRQAGIITGKGNHDYVGEIDLNHAYGDVYEPTPGFRPCVSGLRVGDKVRVIGIGMVFVVHGRRILDGNHH